MTIRDIQAHLARTIGTELSHDTISKITDAVLEEVKAWQSRPLDPRRFLSVVANRWSEPSSHELSWGAVAEDESGSVVEFVSYLGQAFVADLVEVRAL